MPTVQQLPMAVAVNLTDEVMLDQGGTSVAATVAQVLDALPLGAGLVRSGNTLAADTTLLAPLASPALTGMPTAPTQAAGDNSTRLATTAFVLANAVSGGGTLTLTGDVTGSGSSTIATTLAAVVTPGAYEKVTVDAKGRVTAGGALGSSDIAAALGFTPIAGNQTITLSGDLSGSGTTAITATLPAVVTPGTYQQVIVDAKGRVTAGSSLAGADLSASDVTASGSATARTLGTRANDRINVLDYGADPTGVADSADAFTAAMNVVASGDWGSVFVPRGSYKLGSAVNRPAGRSIAVIFDDGANITGTGYLGVDRIESTQGAFRYTQNAGGWFGFAPVVGDPANPGFDTDLIFNTPQNSLSMRVGWDRRYTNTNIYGKAHSGIDIAEQRIHSWPNMYDNSSGWGLWEVVEGTTLDEDTAARAGLSASAELSEIDVVNNGAEAGWTWQAGLANATQGMSIDPWGQNGVYGGNILFTYGTVGSYDGNVGGLNQRWFSYPAVFSAGNPTVTAGTLIIDGTTVNVTAGESLASIATAINAAAIANVRAQVSTWGGVVSRLVIYSTVANDQGTLTLSGTAVGALGFATGTSITPRGNYAAVIGGSGSVAVGDQLVVNGTTVTVGGAGAPSDVAAAINAANIAGIAADTNANGVIVVTCYMPQQPNGLVLANVSGGSTLGALGLNPGSYLPPTPPKAFATAYSDQTTPVCLPTDQITITATDAAGTVHGPVTATLNGGGGSGWPADVAASLIAALTTAGFLSSNFTALSTGTAMVAVRAVGGGANQGVQIRNTAGGTLTLADAHGTPLETLGIAPATYQPGGYSAGSQTVFMAAENAIAAGGRGVFIGGVSNATDRTVFPHTPFEARGGFLHGLRLDQATFGDNNAIVVAPTHTIAWGSKAQGQDALGVVGGTLEFNGAPIVNSVALDGAFGSQVGDLLVRSAGGWVALTPGAQGQLLGANGPGTSLAWTTAIPAAAAGTLLAASGTAGIAETLVLGTNLSLSGNTLEVATFGPNDVLANASGGNAQPAATALTALLDSALGNNQGMLAYRDSTSWEGLLPGASGAFLQSQGAGNALLWVAQEWTAGAVSSLGAGLTLSSGVLNTSDRVIFGTGVDGNVTVSTGITLARDMCYANLTLAAGGSIDAGNFRIYVSGTLDISAAGAGAITNNGLAGNAASGTAAGASSALGGGFVAGLPQPQQSGQRGGIPATGAGGAGVASVSATGFGGGGTAGGNGGAGGTGAGGAGGVLGPPQWGDAGAIPSLTLGPWFAGTGSVFYPGNSGASGGAGGGDGTNDGGGGGGGAFGGRYVAIAASTIYRGTNSTAGIIQAKGAAGGNGGTPTVGNAGGGGAGSGSGGGVVFIVAGALTGTQIANAVDVSGGSGANGGNGVGTGGGGYGTAGAYNGSYFLNVLSPPSTSLVIQQGTAAGAAATAPSGITGGTGGAAAVSQGAL